MYTDSLGMYIYARRLGTDGANERSERATRAERGSRGPSSERVRGPGDEVPRIRMKVHRQAQILELVATHAVTSQEQLRALLRERGIETTQATLSRDIRDLGLVKRAADGAYRRPNAVATATDATAAVRRAVEEYLRSQDRVEQLIVLKTDPGQAQSLAIVLDRFPLPEIVGTIAGDDTILVICRSPTQASALADRLEGMRVRVRES
jgi:transcriptional regulator of arginine metabolism